MRRFVLLFVVSSLAFAPAPLPRPERRPQANPFRELEGHWVNSRTPLHITPRRYTHSADRDYELTIDKSFTPHHYEIHGIGRQNVGDDFIGIYKVEGDKLTVSYNSKGTRPTTFDGPDQGFTEVFDRVRR